jgi:hypothetical protein
MNPTMPLEFIDNNATIDRAARRRIRSHVAMGRNAGKTFVRLSRKKLGLGMKNTKALIRIPKVIEGTRDSESNDHVVHEIERQVGDGLSVLSIPQRPSPESTGLIQRGMYSLLKSENSKLNHPISLLIILYYLVFSFISGSQDNPEASIASYATWSHTSMWVQFMFLDEACVYYFSCLGLYLTPT